MNYCPNCGCKLPHNEYHPPVQPYTPYTPYPTYPYWFNDNKFVTQKEGIAHGTQRSPQS